MDVTATGKTLGKDDFLRLFTSQLRYQNPLKPLEGAEFTAQLAQFSTLEQLYNMNNSFQQLLAYQNSLNNGLVSGLIGKYVKTVDGMSGKVVGVAFEQGVTYLKLDNGKQISLGQIKEISENA